MAEAAPNPLDEFDVPAKGGGNPLDEFDKPEPAGVGRQFVGGVSKGIVDVLTLPYRALTEGAKEAAERRRAEGHTYPMLPEARKLEDMSLYRPFLVQPEPQTTGERFARSSGEAVGQSAVPMGVTLGKAEKLAALAPTTVPRAFGRQIGEFVAETPGKAVAADVAGASASGVGSQAAREAELGPGWEIAAGAVAPVVPIAAGATVSAPLRAGANAVSPTLARWQANGNALLRRMGIEASADGGIPENVGGRAAADQILANQLRRAGISVDQIEQVLAQSARNRQLNSNSFAQDATALVDTDPSLQKLAGSVVRSSPEANNMASDFLYARQTGQTPARGPLPEAAGLPTRKVGARVGADETPAGQGERLEDGLRRALLIEDAASHGHGKNAYRTAQQLSESAKERAQPLYDATYKAGDGVDLAPVVKPILDKWKAAAAEEPGPVAAAVKAMIAEYERALAPGAAGKKSMIERFDKAKQFSDGTIENYHTSSEGRNRYTGGALTKLKNELLGAVDDIKTNDLGSKYKAARGDWGSHMEAKDAIELGRSVWKADSDVGVDAIRAMDAAGHSKLVRLGLFDGYRAAASRMKTGADKTQLFDNPRIQEILSEAIPRSKRGTAEFADRPERFGGYVGDEQRMVQTRNTVKGNSATAERMQDDADFDKLQTAMEGMKNPSILGYSMKAVKYIFNKAFGYRADTAEELAKSLFTADPAQRAQTLARIREHMGQERFTYFSNLMQAQARQYAAHGAATAAPGAAEHGTAGSPVAVSAPADADKLPSGTHIITPDGRHKVVP